MSGLEKMILQNRSPLHKIPIINRIATRYLLRRCPIGLGDLQFSTKHAASYALISEKRSTPFEKIASRLERYLGAGTFGPNKHWEYPWVIANLRLEPGMSVLDAGCGTSPVQYLLSQVGCRVSGVDAHEGAEWHGIDRRLARRFGCKIDYRCEGIDALSFADATFDRVCCVSVIEHCRNREVENEKMTPLTDGDLALQRKIMGELVRVLKPGGILAVTVDFNIPREDCLLDSNVDVANLLAVEGTELTGERTPLAFPGEDGFDFRKLIHNSDIDVVDYWDTLQTSIGLALRRKST